MVSGASRGSEAIQLEEIFCWRKCDKITSTSWSNLTPQHNKPGQSVPAVFVRENYGVKCLNRHKWMRAASGNDSVSTPLALFVIDPPTLESWCYFSWNVLWSGASLNFAVRQIHWRLTVPWSVPPDQDSFLWPCQTAELSKLLPKLYSYGARTHPAFDVRAGIRWGITGKLHQTAALQLCL